MDTIWIPLIVINYQVFFHRSPEPAKPKENPVLSNKSELITLESTAKYGRHITV